MDTGIVSIALHLDGREDLSRTLLGLTAAIWIALAGLAGLRLAADRPRFLAEARSPGGLTGVAATSVLGSRLLELGWNVPGEALLVLAFAIWVPLEPLVARRLPGRVTGEWFMVVVAIQSLAVLSAELAAGRRLRSSAARWRSRRWPSPS